MYHYNILFHYWLFAFYLLCFHQLHVCVHDGLIVLYVFTLFTMMQVDITQDLRGILIRIGRFKSLEMHYTKVHLKPIKQLWEDFDSRQSASKLASDRNEMERLSSNNDSPTISFSSWLPSFYDELLLYLEQEWKWYYSCCKVYQISDSWEFVSSKDETMEIRFSTSIMLWWIYSIMTRLLLMSEISKS